MFMFVENIGLEIALREWPRMGLHLFFPYIIKIESGDEQWI